MDQACELIRLLPELLAGRGLLKRVPLEPIANQIRDVLDEFQVASLRLRRGLSTLKNL